MDYGLYCLEHFGSKKKFFSLYNLTINVFHKVDDTCSIMTVKRSDYDKNDDTIYTINVNFPKKVCLDILKLISNKYVASRLRDFFESTRKGYDRYNLTDQIIISAVAKLDSLIESKTEKSVPFIATRVFDSSKK